MSAKHARLFGVVIVSLFMTTPAYAGDRNSGGERDSASVTLDIVGRIAPVCTIDLPPRAELGELSRAGEAFVPFSLACNKPLSYALQSEQGGLRHNTHGQFVVPYTAQLQLDGESARRGRAMRSGDMQNAPAGDDLRGYIPFENEGALRIRWEAPPSTLAQGRYRDVITITLVVDGQ